MSPVVEPRRRRAQVDEEVFKRSFIPRNLFEVVDAERDARKLADGDTSGVPSLPGPVGRGRWYD